MDKQRFEWLASEIKSWQREGLIEPENAESILKRYQFEGGEESATSWSSVILASLGALLIGGGVILLFAHNWDALGKSARTVLSFVPLLIAQGFAFYAYKYRPDSRGWAESTAILVFLAIASSIALIGQTYHIYGNLERFFIAWLLLALPLVYVMRSKAVFLLCCIVIVCLCTIGDKLNWLWYLALIPSWLVMYRQPHQWGFLWASWFGAIGLFTSVMMSFDYISSPVMQYAVLVALLFSVGYYILGKYLFGINGVGFWQNPFSNLGALSIAYISLWLTWDEAWQIRSWGWGYYGRGREQLWQAGDIMTLVVLGAVFAAIAYGFYHYRRQLSLSSKFLLGISLFTLVPFISMATGLAAGWFSFAMNFYILAASLALIFEGVNSQRLKVLNAGLVWLSLLIAVRFFDSDISFVIKGITFILIGCMFIAANIWFKKRQTRLMQQRTEQKAQQGAHHEA